MGDPIVLLWLAISIAIILVLILKLKMNAALAMFVGALFMGFASGEASPRPFPTSAPASATR